MTDYRQVITFTSMPGEFGMALSSGVVLRIRADTVVHTPSHYLFATEATTTRPDGTKHADRFEVARFTDKGSVVLLVGGAGRLTENELLALRKAASGDSFDDPVAEPIGLQTRRARDEALQRQAVDNPTAAKYFNYERVLGTSDR